MAAANAGHAVRLPRLEEHWVNQARGVNGEELPASVYHRWLFYASRGNRARYGYYCLEAASLVIAASIPAVAALGAGAGTAAVLGAVLVAVNGIRQLVGLHEEWISFSRARYDIEREVVAFMWGRPPYDADDAAAVLAAAVEEISTTEGQRFLGRRERAAASLGTPVRVPAGHPPNPDPAAPD